MYKNIGIILSILFFGGCQVDMNLSVNPKETDTTDFTGIWYQADSDRYLVLSEEGQAEMKVCSVNTGYADWSGVELSYSGDQLTTSLYTFGDGVSTMSRTGDALRVEGNDQPADGLYEKKAVIPEICENDALEVVSISPETVVAGEETVFTVEVAYRLASVESSTISLSASKSVDNGTIQAIGVDSTPVSQGMNTEVLTFTATPTVLIEGVPYLLVLYFGQSNGSALTGTLIGVDFE